MGIDVSLTKPVYLFSTMDSFTAIDFELANADYTSICAVGVVCVEKGEIIKEYYSLVRPPENKYMWQATRVHGIKAKDTENAPSFPEVYKEIAPLLKDRGMVAHNEKFDRSVLQKAMKRYGLSYKELGLKPKWVCTSELYKSKGFVRTKLNICCDIMGVKLQHHEALSDARACAMLYLKREEAEKKLKEIENNSVH